ncbi:MAG: hypothetical protein HZY75_13350 [Nocardioidaceae bacterium]|nr:MAG: hypothetical protein HZY75_13350 [Nocardioidaceae bacterium]
MARKGVTLDHAGIASILKSAGVASVIQSAAETMKADIEAAGVTVGDRDGGPREIALPVTVTMLTTDRAKARVSLAHAAGEAVQVKHGLLTKAAGAAGLDVRAKK